MHYLSIKYYSVTSIAFTGIIVIYQIGITFKAGDVLDRVTSIREYENNSTDI